MATSEEVLAYWFPDGLDTEEQLGKQMGRWFQGGPAVDAEIRDRFGAAVVEATEGKLDHWADTARGRLALIVLLDQFTRNVFRGRADAFAADPKAQRLVDEGLARGHHDALPSMHERLFFALPLEHAEDLGRQKRSVALAERAYIDASPALRKLAAVTVSEARKHLDVIARFGRFPHRNATLGRESTPDERAYLEYLRVSGQHL